MSAIDYVSAFTAETHPRYWSISSKMSFLLSLRLQEQVLKYFVILLNVSHSLPPFSVLSTAPTKEIWLEGTEEL